jgi:signal transduction histidine kinase
MNSTEHFFEADAAIIARLGRELVAKQETALIELVKNSYDADSTEVEVSFMTQQAVPAMEIRDNGSGMTKEDLVEGFLRLASDKKISEPLSPKYQRRRAGRKGIGRFSAHRLGDKLILTTRHHSQSLGWRLEVNWTKFSRGTELSAVPVTITQVEVAVPGTVMRIEHLFDEWSDATIKRCWRNVLRLQQPFPVAPIEKNPIKDPGFSVSFVRENALFRDESVVADLQTEILDHMHAVIEFKVDDHGYASWCLSRNRFDVATDWVPVNSLTPDARVPGPYLHLKNAWMRTYYVILAPDLLSTLVYTRVRDELANFGGVRLYRNGFRVVPYGDNGNDWLGLDELSVKRSFLAPISNRNFFGIVEVRDPDGLMFEEHTSREGLLETSAFAELKHLTSSVLVTAAASISDSRGKKTRASDKKVPTVDPFSKLKTAIHSLVISSTEPALKAEDKGSPNPTAIEAEKVLAIAAEIQQHAEIAKSELADETAMLRLLATLGMTTAEFSHETGMTFDAFRFDFERVFKAAIDAQSNDPIFLAKAARARAMLARLDTLTSYLNTLASSRSTRDVRPVSLSKVVEEFEKGIRLQAQTQGIDLVVNVPEFDPLYTRPMHEAEIASILLNLYTNAVKAVKRNKADRRVSIRVELADDEASVRLLFSDSGDGIPVHNRERIFDAFFTTRIGSPGSADDVEHTKGTGLGLWIVHQIVANAGGQIAVVDAEDGFATTLELILPKENEDA